MKWFSCIMVSELQNSCYYFIKMYYYLPHNSQIVHSAHPQITVSAITTTVKLWFLKCYKFPVNCWRSMLKTLTLKKKVSTIWDFSVLFMQVRKCKSLKGCKRNPQPGNRNFVVIYKCQDNGKKTNTHRQTTKPVIYFTRKAQQNTPCIKILTSGMDNYAWKKIPVSGNSSSEHRQPLCYSI